MIKSYLSALTLACVLSFAATAAIAAETAVTPPASAVAGLEKAKAAKAAIDTDGNGSVSKAEFLAYQEKRFVEIDTNKDGSISDEEHKASVQKWASKRNDLKGAAPAKGK